MSRYRPWMIVVVLLCIAVWIVWATSPSYSEESSAPRREEVWVPMPDGVRLAATVYFPEGDGPWPTLLVRTYDGRSAEAGLAALIQREGIVTVVQDVRGRFDSEGEMRAYAVDRQDGQATLDWIAVQSWNNGRIGTYGVAAQGVAAYLLAPGANAALKCQWFVLSGTDQYTHSVYPGGAYRAEKADTWLESLGALPLTDELKAHPTNDAVWDPMQVTGLFDQVHTQAVHVGGWYSLYAKGTVDAFQGFQSQGGTGAAGQQYLIMGPWALGFASRVGSFDYPAAVPDAYQEWVTAWFDRCLLGKSSAVDEWPVVRYFTMGAVGEAGAPGNTWQEAQTWPPEGSVETPLYLGDQHALSFDLPAAGSNAGDTFTYDPADPSPTLGGTNITTNGPQDQRPVEARDDGVVYTSDVLESPLEVTGGLRADLWFTTDVPDTDLVVRLTDVYPDGRSMLVADGLLRARYHNSPDFTSWDFLQPGVPYKASVDLWVTSIIFNAGHRIRISVTSSNAPRFTPNPNTGEMFLKAGETGQVAHTTILHSAEYPSAMILPVMQR